MTLETTQWHVQQHIRTEAEQLAYLAAAFEITDLKFIEAVLGDIIHARDLPAPDPATTDVHSLTRAMKVLGLKTARAT